MKKKRTMNIPVGAVRAGSGRAECGDILFRAENGGVVGSEAGNETGGLEQAAEAGRERCQRI